jgi:Cytochrome P450
MVETLLAFDLSKTRTVCDAFDDAWAFLQGSGSDLTEPSKSLESRTILAKRIIEMADHTTRCTTRTKKFGRRPNERPGAQERALVVGAGSRYRFTVDRTKARPRYAYLPFGAGPRVSIGASFAMIEATVI